jgi:hypothetical protein
MREDGTRSKKLNITSALGAVILSSTTSRSRPGSFPRCLASALADGNEYGICQNKANQYCDRDRYGPGYDRQPDRELSPFHSVGANHAGVTGLLWFSLIRCNQRCVRR